MRQNKLKPAIAILKRGGVGIMPTDTLYGLVGRALDRSTVERIYKLKNRDSRKPFIILISRFSDLSYFGIKLERKDRKILKRYWPGPVSVVLKNYQQGLDYLHRGGDSLAFRLVRPLWLRKILKKTGPLVSPSANPEGLPPAKNIEEAKEYFSDKVDFYVDSGPLDAEPSTIISLDKGSFEILRQGGEKI